MLEINRHLFSANRILSTCQLSQIEEIAFEGQVAIKLKFVLKPPWIM